jgi:hypothetical protein
MQALIIDGFRRGPVSWGKVNRHYQAVNTTILTNERDTDLATPNSVGEVMLFPLVCLQHTPLQRTQRIPFPTWPGLR